MVVVVVGVAVGVVVVANMALRVCVICSEGGFSRTR